MAAEKIFLAGASGVIGMRLSCLLRDAGYKVFGTTRSAREGEDARGARATPVVVECSMPPRSPRNARAAALDRDASAHRPSARPRSRPLSDSTAERAHPPRGNEESRVPRPSAGATRMIAQSIAWAYQPECAAAHRGDPLDIKRQGARAPSPLRVWSRSRRGAGIAAARGSRASLRTTSTAPTPASSTSPTTPSVHVDAAARAALCSRVEHAGTGILNIADDNGVVSTEKARRELGWDASYRIDT